MHPSDTGAKGAPAGTSQWLSCTRFPSLDLFTQGTIGTMRKYCRLYYLSNMVKPKIGSWRLDHGGSKKGIRYCWLELWFIALLENTAKKTIWKRN